MHKTIIPYLIATELCQNKNALPGLAWSDSVLISSCMLRFLAFIPLSYTLCLTSFYFVLQNVFDISIKKYIVQNIFFIFLPTTFTYTLQMFTHWKLQALGITGSLQGKPALSMEKDCNNYKETLCMLWINPVIFTNCRKTPW